MRDDLRRAGRLLEKASSVLVLTGAGVSAESGVPIFRGSEGLWRKHRPEDLATPGAFRRDPRLVWEWYQWRRDRVGTAEPNAAHHALARLVLGREGVTLVTQNVDGLHEEALRRAAAAEEAPVRRVADTLPLLLHGSIFRLRCTRCDHGETRIEPVDTSSEASLPRCPPCGALLRPDVVWFGESLPADVVERAFAAARAAEIALVVGTSAGVHPAASLPGVTLGAGGAVVEVNPEETPVSAHATVRIGENAGEVLPALVEAALSGAESHD